jgi:hypothetical protein
MFPDNTLTAFTIHLAEPIELGLTDKWQVGVSEFSCPAAKTGTYQAFEIVGEFNLL